MKAALQFRYCLAKLDYEDGAKAQPALKRNEGVSLQEKNQLIKDCLFNLGQLH